MTLLLALLVPYSAIAETETLRPQRLHWCAALMTAGDANPEARADRTRALNELDARIEDGRAVVTDGPAQWTLKLLRWAGRSFHKGQAFAFGLNDVRDQIHARRNITELDEVSERLRAIERDISTLQDRTIAFAHVVTGQDQIESYVNAVEARARAMEDENRLNLKSRTRSPYYWLRPTLRLGASIFFTTAFLTYTLNNFANHSYFLPLNALLTMAAGADLLRDIRRASAYLKGLRSARAWVAYENAYDPERTHGYDEHLKAVLRTAREGERPLAYASFRFDATNDVVDNLLRGAPATVPGETETTSTAEQPLDPVPRKILMDLFSYRNEDDQSVLMTVVRITRPDRHGNEKTPPRRSTHPRGRFGGTPGGLAPAGI